MKKCSARKNRSHRRLSPTRLKRLATPKMLRVLLTFEKHFHHLNIFQIENFLKIIYEKDYQTPREFIKSLSKKTKSPRGDKNLCKKRMRGLEGFGILKLDECDEWKCDENCYSIIDFYPRNEEESIKSESETEVKMAEMKLENVEQKKHDSEISFLRPSQINIAKSDCERIFKKLEAFHAMKMDRKPGRGSEDIDGNETKKSRKKKGKDDGEKKVRGRKGGKAGDDVEIEEEEEEDEEEEEEEVDICAKIVEKEPEWNVEWRG